MWTTPTCSLWIEAQRGSSRKRHFTTEFSKKKNFHKKFKCHKMFNPIFQSHDFERTRNLKRKNRDLFFRYIKILKIHFLILIFLFQFFRYRYAIFYFSVMVMDSAFRSIRVFLLCLPEPMIVARVGRSTFASVLAEWQTMDRFEDSLYGLSLLLEITGGNPRYIVAGTFSLNLRAVLPSIRVNICAVNFCKLTKR